MGQVKRMQRCRVWLNVPTEPVLGRDVVWLAVRIYVARDKNILHVYDYDFYFVQIHFKILILSNYILNIFKTH
jgi:hypothetical protein